VPYFENLIIIKLFGISQYTYNKKKNNDINLGVADSIKPDLLTPRPNPI
jgi:hypothetical protein